MKYTKRFSLFFLLIACVGFAQEPVSVNKAHLFSLIERIDLNGDSVCVVDIYSDFPKYAPVEAKGEGFACVDDAARAAVFFMRYNEIFEKTDDEGVIRGLLKFVLDMQLDDGRFYNFVNRDGNKIVVNENGPTSYGSFGWWAARAMWALGEGAVYFKHRDPDLYARILSATRKSMGQVDSVLSSYNRTDSAGYPAWLLYKDGADASSELVLGLDRLFDATGDRKYLAASEKFCDGMLRLQAGSSTVPPYFAFLSNHDGWHGWANSQSAALLDYSRISGDTTFRRFALNEIEFFMPRWAGALFFRACSSKGDHLDYSGQIAYSIRPALTAVSEAFGITHDPRFKVLAGVVSSWFFGNNTARTTFYFSNTGICFDGTEDSLRVNKNSGAESTVEALLSMLALKKMGVEFNEVERLSRPSFNSDEYDYSIGGKHVTLRLTASGFGVQ